MYCQVHQTELGVVLHLFLAVEGHGIIGQHTSLFDEVARLDEHAAAATGRVQQDTLGRLEHIDNHLGQRFGGEENAVILGDVLGKFVEEILVDASDDVTAHIVQGTVVKDSQQLRQQFI